MGEDVMSDGQQQFRLGIVGYGEIGSTWGKGLRQSGLEQIASYDKYAFDGPYASLIQRRAAEAGVTLVRSNEELARTADIILGATTGSASIESAEAFAPHLGADHVFVDVASATPKVKMAVAERLARTGALVGDASIMGTPKNGLQMPILASGPAAERVRDALNPWGMQIDAVSERLGTASGIKILRSVLIKGMEALLDEMLLAARHYGLEEAVLASASKTMDRPFMATIDTLLSAGAIHAKRRAEEVEMAADAVADAGIEPVMARATVARLRLVEQLGLKEHFGGVAPPSHKERIDVIAAKLAQARSNAT
jgi:3-hydroxyisobutyrate dehydrogenase-like beta-hydroxyacid dehydrogenase